MIFYSENKNKFILLTILTIFFGSLIFWRWLNFMSKLEIAPLEEPMIQEVTQEIDSSLTDVKNSVSQGTQEFDTVKTELEKEVKQEELLEATRNYLETKE